MRYASLHKYDEESQKSIRNERIAWIVWKLNHVESTNRAKIYLQRDCDDSRHSFIPRNFTSRHCNCAPSSSSFYFQICWTLWIHNRNLCKVSVLLEFFQSWFESLFWAKLINQRNWENATKKAQQSLWIEMSR